MSQDLVAVLTAKGVAALNDQRGRRPQTPMTGTPYSREMARFACAGSKMS